MTINNAAAADPGEAGEIGQHCRKCGAAKAEFDVFCNNCHSPLVRRFGLLLPFEILLFLGTAVVMAMVRQNRLPDWCGHAPLAFIVQAFSLYLIRLSLRQPRFLFILALYILFIGTLLAGIATEATLLEAAPLYVGLGTLVLWYSRRSSQTRHVSFQTFWVAFLVGVVGVGQFLKATSAKYHVGGLKSLLPMQQSLLHYAPWLTLAGFAITFGIESAMRVSHRGIVVGHYLQSARIVPGPRGATPLLMVPLVVLSRALIAFYNAMVGVLALLIRCVVFMLKIAQAYTVALGIEAVVMVAQILRFLVACVARVGLPLFLTAFIARLTVQADSMVPTYAFAADWHGAMMLALQTGMMALAILACVVCFARVSPPAFFETFLRDGAVIAGYGLPLLLVCTFALQMANRATRNYFALDLPYRVGPFGWMTLGLLAFAMLVLWRRRSFSPRNKSLAE